MVTRGWFFRLWQLDHHLLLEAVRAARPTGSGGGCHGAVCQNPVGICLGHHTGSLRIDDSLSGLLLRAVDLDRQPVTGRLTDPQETKRSARVPQSCSAAAGQRTAQVPATAPTPPAPFWALRFLYAACGRYIDEGCVPMGSSAWQYIEPYSGDLAGTLANVRQREFERVFIEGTRWEGLQVAGRPVAALEDLDELWEDDEEFGSTGTHTVVDVWRLVEPTAYDGFNTVRPLPAEEVAEIFGTERPTPADFEQAQARYKSRERGSEALWEMPRWSAWCTLLTVPGGAATLVAFWGRSGD